jgi:O-antigen/teichoic acid export membrane protein
LIIQNLKLVNSIFMLNRSSLYAFLDQVWLSAISFIISIAFIKFSTKSEFGIYSVLFSAILLIQGLQNAVLISPLGTVLPRHEELHKLRVIHTNVYGHLFFSTLFASVAALLLLLFQFINEKIDFYLALGFFIAILGTMGREAVRSINYSQFKVKQAFASDLKYGAILIISLFGLLYFDRINTSTVFLVTGLAGLIPLVNKVSIIKKLRFNKAIWQEFWSCGRWATVSVGITWVSLNAYPYFVTATLGLYAVADISASRLFLMPVALFASAWSNLNRPKITKFILTKNIVDLKKLTITSTTLGLSILAFFISLVYLIYPFLESLMGQKYMGLFHLVLMWALYFAVNLVRTFFMASLMANSDGYRQLHHITWATFTVSILGFLFFTSKGPIFVIGVLCVAEIFQLLLVALQVSKLWRGL